jgi:hypothetical protein
MLIDGEIHRGPVYPATPNRCRRDRADVCVITMRSLGRARLQRRSGQDFACISAGPQRALAATRSTPVRASSRLRRSWPALHCDVDPAEITHGERPGDSLLTSIAPPESRWQTPSPPSVSSAMGPCSDSPTSCSAAENTCRRGAASARSGAAPSSLPSVSNAMGSLLGHPPFRVRRRHALRRSQARCRRGRRFVLVPWKREALHKSRSAAPGWQGARSDNTGRIRATSNAARRDAPSGELCDASRFPGV